MCSRRIPAFSYITKMQTQIKHGYSSHHPLIKESLKSNKTPHPLIQIQIQISIHPQFNMHIIRPESDYQREGLKKKDH
jgi:hypothetical protein